MDGIMTKLEKMVEGYLDNLETKPVRTLFITIFIYYIFKILKRRN